MAALQQARQGRARLRQAAAPVPPDDGRRPALGGARPARGRSAPPAPDKTADRTSAGRDGFTGFEAFWDYAYWQALAINGRDSKSHILRINAFPGACADYRATDQGAGAVFQECNQILGPSQPGIGGQPDPTDRELGRLAGGQASRSRADEQKKNADAGDSRDAKRKELAKDGGKPAAAPTSPEGVQKRSADVLDQLLGGVLGGGERRPTAPAQSDTRSNETKRPPGANEEMLLDYLLKP